METGPDFLTMVEAHRSITHLVHLWQYLTNILIAQETQQWALQVTAIAIRLLDLIL